MPHAENFLDVQGSRVFVHYAIRGTGQNGIIGISKVTEFDAPPVTRADGGMEIYTDAQEVKLKGEGMQTNYAAIKRAILLCGSMLTTAIRFGVDWYNFVNPYDLGVEVTITISQQDILIEYDFHGRCYPDDWAAVLAATGAMMADITGATGGSTITGLTGEAFDDAEYGFPGLIGVYVGTGDLATDDELGLKEASGSKCVVKIGAPYSTLRAQPLSNHVEIKNTLSLLENRGATVNRGNSYANKEKVITWKFNDSIFVFHNCTKFASGPSFKDNGGLLVMKNEGSTFLDPINGTPTNIVFDDPNKTVNFYKQVA